MDKKYGNPLLPRVQDIIGNRYNRWIVIAFSHTHNKASYWICRCDCGTIRTHQRSALVSMSTGSCGCLRGELLAGRSTTHGMSHTTEYNSWRGLKQRCQNPNFSKFSIYGGRGITVCERWQRFENFFADMGYKPKPDYTIERIDNDGNYEPDNCCWIPPAEQAVNRRNNHLVSIDGRTLTLAEWRRHFGIKRSTFDHRLRRDWSIKDALTTPAKKYTK